MVKILVVIETFIFNEDFNDEARHATFIIFMMAIMIIIFNDEGCVSVFVIETFIFPLSIALVMTMAKKDELLRVPLWLCLA